MHSLFTKLLLAGMLVLLAMPAYGEYYQYTDANGTLRFTDDFANVPRDQRPDAKTYESVKSSPAPSVSHERVNGKRSGESVTSSDSASHLAGTWQEKISRKANELDRLQEELSRTYVDLQAERDALEAKAPRTGATQAERDAYREWVDALNARIEGYEKQYVEYKEKEQSFNDRYR